MPQGPDMGRRRATAPAQDGHAILQERAAPLGEFLRRHVVGRFPVHQSGQARVGLNHHRQVGVPQNLSQHGPQLLRPQRAVEADPIRPQTGQRHRSSSRVHPQEGPSVLPEGHGDKHRQACPLLRRQQSGLGLQQVAHGFNEDQVRPCPLPHLHDVCKLAVSLLEGHLAERLQQHP